MIYELRIYHVSPGKMKDVNDRVANHTLHIFAKHGMRVIEFWQGIESNDGRLYYVLEFPDMETRDNKFKSFRNDPEWQRVKSESETNGPIVEHVESVFLKNVPYFQRV